MKAAILSLLATVAFAQQQPQTGPFSTVPIAQPANIGQGVVLNDQQQFPQAMGMSYPGMTNQMYPGSSMGQQIYPGMPGISQQMYPGMSGYPMTGSPSQMSSNFPGQIARGWRYGNQQQFPGIGGQMSPNFGGNMQQFPGQTNFGMNQQFPGFPGMAGGLPGMQMGGFPGMQQFPGQMGGFQQNGQFPSQFGSQFPGQQFPGSQMTGQYPGMTGFPSMGQGFKK